MILSYVCFVYLPYKAGRFPNSSGDTKATAESIRSTMQRNIPAFVDTGGHVAKLHPQCLSGASRVNPAYDTLSFSRAGLFSKKRES